MVTVTSSKWVCAPCLASLIASRSGTRKSCVVTPVMLVPATVISLAPVHVHGLLAQVPVKAVLPVLAAQARLLPAVVKPLDQFAVGTVEIDLAELEPVYEPHQA